jgi:hypothetical protein
LRSATVQKVAIDGNPDRVPMNQLFGVVLGDPTQSGGEIAMPAKNRCRAALCVLVTLLSAGCEVVLFEHPLSDEKTSKPDERLLGDWTPFHERR